MVKSETDTLLAFVDELKDFSVSLLTWIDGDSKKRVYGVFQDVGNTFSQVGFSETDEYQSRVAFRNHVSYLSELMS